MSSLCVVLRKPPYGSVEGAEAVRHALGGITEDLPVKMLLVDGGVNAARKGQDMSDTGYASLEEGIRDCIEMGAEVYADALSLKLHAMSPDDVIEGVLIVDSHAISAIIGESLQVMIF